MIQVTVNDQELPIEASSLRTIGELVEYIKASIDPETVILSFTKDDEPLSDFDWRSPLSSMNDVKFSIQTGSKTEFVSQRIHLVDTLANSLVENLGECAAGFKQLRIATANQGFVTFVEDLNAFVGWFHAIIQVDDELFADEIVAYTKLVQRLQAVCSSLSELQVHSSWWALGDALTNQLKPIVIEIAELGKEVSSKLQS